MYFWFQASDGSSDRIVNVINFNKLEHERFVRHNIVNNFESYIMQVVGIMAEKNWVMMEGGQYEPPTRVQDNLINFFLDLPITNVHENNESDDDNVSDVSSNEGGDEDSSDDESGNEEDDDEEDSDDEENRDDDDEDSDNGSADGSDDDSMPPLEPRQLDFSCVDFGSVDFRSEPLDEPPEPVVEPLTNGETVPVLSRADLDAITCALWDWVLITTP